MANLRLFFTLLISVFIIYSGAFAGPKGYMCTVETELHLSNDGSLEPYPKPLAVGEQFAVDRSTGNLIKALSWWMIVSAKTVVLSQGSPSSSFMAIYTAPAADNGIFHTTLYIKEFTKGIEKPFLLTSNGSVYAGVCE